MQFGGGGSNMTSAEKTIDNTARAPSAWLAYVWLAVSVGVLGLISYNFGDEILRRLGNIEDAPTAPILASLVLFGLCSFASFYSAWRTPLPSFLVAIALGMAGHTLFAPIVANREMLSALVTVSAAVILFGGGLEMPLSDFMRLLVKILLLAIPGVLISGFTLSWVIGATAPALGFAVPIAVVIVLGGILASTDPAAIIPLLENLRFKHRAAKDIVIAESALNDVVGTLLTSAFFKLPLATMTLFAAYQSLFSAGTARFLGIQAGFGLLFGFIGYLLLQALSRMKRGHQATHGADQVFFLITPIIAFLGASIFGGSGFLAAFVAGLLFHAEDHMQRVEHFFFHVIDGVAKPVIFLLLGALVNLQALAAYAPEGILVALIFIFVLRPMMVFLVLGGYALRRESKNSLSLNELLFISFVRETGAIPAVLLVTAVSAVAAPVNGLVEIGMWVILLTLLISPPFTPWVARKLGVAE
jgi:NhaP-type Na+/H+ or K+/H+ antiporter